MSIKSLQRADQGGTPYHFIAAGSMAADYTSPAIYIGLVDTVGLQINFAGSTPTGIFQVLVSVDNVNYNVQPLVDEEGAAYVPAAAGDGSLCLDLPLPYPYMKLFFDRTSGTGTLEGYVFGK